MKNTETKTKIQTILMIIVLLSGAPITAVYANSSASCGENPPDNLLVYGNVYHDENGDGIISEREDTHLSDVIVEAISGNHREMAVADSNGHYVLSIRTDRTYKIQVSDISEFWTYDPEEQEWGRHSTVYGLKEKIRCPGAAVNIAAGYKILNYGKEDSRWELWHAGPIAKKSENVILVHGAQLPDMEISGQISKGQLRKVYDKEFGNMANFLQTKRNGGFNVWEFEYAEKKIGGRYYTCDNISNYSRRLNQAMDFISTNTNPEMSVVSRSLGGLIARYSAHTTGNNFKIITLDTEHYGYVVETRGVSYPGFRLLSDMRKDSPVFKQLNDVSNRNSRSILSLTISGDEPFLGEKGLVSFNMKKYANENFSSFKSENKVFQVISNYLKNGSFPES